MRRAGGAMRWPGRGAFDAPTPVLPRGRRAARRRASLLVAGLLAAWALAAALTATAASAATGYVHAGAFGAGCGATGMPACPVDGLFHATTMPQRIAVHDASGKVFVVDRGNNRVQVFEPGTPPTFAYAIDGAGALTSPVSVAIDQSNGALYVTTTGTPHRIVKLVPDDATDPSTYTVDPTFASPAQGTGAGQVGALSGGNASNPLRGGIAVDPGTGDVIVGDPGRNLVHRLDSDGTFLSSFNGTSVAPARGAFTGVADVAVSSNGDIVVVDIGGANARVDRYSAAGVLQATLSQSNSPVPNATLGQRGIAVAANPGTGEVFVASSTATAFSGPVPGTIFQFEGDQVVATVSATGDGMSGFIFGIGLRTGADGALYAVASQAVGTFGATPEPRVQVFDGLQPPEAAIAPVDPESVTATGATLAGEVNPHGNAVEWRFEARPAGGAAGWPHQTDWQPLEAGSELVPVSAEIGGLDPFTDYEARLVARSSQGLIGASGVVSFRTLKAPPLIGLTTAGYLTDEAATLTATVDPRSAPTRYWFEYGPDGGYGTRVPALPATGDAGAGNGYAVVSERVGGLVPGATYHFRVVAENDAGMRTEGSDSTFTTLAEHAGLGATRTYEVASTLPTANVEAVGVTAASEDGDEILYTTEGGAPHLPAVGDVPGTVLWATRHEEGWRSVTRMLSRPRLRGLVGSNNYPSRDMSRELISTAVDSDPDDQNHEPDGPLADFQVGVDLYLRESDGRLTWITRDPRIPVGTPQTTPIPSGSYAVAGTPRTDAMSDDGRTVVFQSRRQLLDSDTTSGSVYRLYRWADSGLEFIGVRPDGSVPANGSELGTGSGGANFSLNAVAPDGRTIVWSARRHDAAPASTTIYIRRDGAPVVEAAKEAGVGSLPSPHPLGVRYWGADRHLSKVFFTSESRLTPDSGASNASPGHADLYVYDVSSGALRDLTPRMDGGDDPNVDPAVQDRARVLGVAAISDDARRVYLVADGRLDALPSPLGREPSPAGRNLYLLELDADGAVLRTQFIVALGAADGDVWANSWTSRRTFTAGDAAVLQFEAQSNLTGQPTGGLGQLFVYDDLSRSLACVSCPVDGSVPAGRVNVRESGVSPWQDLLSHRRLGTADGLVYFDTPTRLVDADQNDVRDVYEYRNGRVRLISAGSGHEASYIESASGDGLTVFFNTTDALAPQDNEPGVRKVYAARVGGGFPVAGEPARCSGDSCQSAPSSPPARPDTATATLRGKGSAEPRRPASPRCARARNRARVAGQRAAKARRAARRARAVPAKRRLSRRAARLTRDARRLDAIAKRCRKNYRRTAR